MKLAHLSLGPSSTHTFIGNTSTFRKDKMFFIPFFSDVIASHLSNWHKSLQILCKFLVELGE
jgi:hypothetical protein